MHVEKFGCLESLHSKQCRRESMHHAYCIDCLFYPHKVCPFLKSDTDFASEELGKMLDFQTDNRCGTCRVNRLEIVVFEMFATFGQGRVILKGFSVDRFSCPEHLHSPLTDFKQSHAAICRLANPGCAK